MKTLGLSNIVVDENVREAGIALTGVNNQLDPVISRLATLNPLWTFVVVAYGSYGYDKGMATAFVVKLDGEPLGKINTAHVGQRRLISISNERIGKTRQRSDSYRTQSPEKAILTAKKMFGRMNSTERVEKATNVAAQVVSSAGYAKERERTEHRRTLDSAMLMWAQTNGRGMFLEFIDKESRLPHKQKITNSIEMLEILNVEMQTIERVQKDFADEKTALVVKDSGKYLVKTGDDIQLYDDNSLPLDTRMKLGMLKLVQDGEYLSDIGCKVTSEIFVLLVDNLTNVSEGA
jgi:hypothetical protein